eukprot:COSAG01_NODE_39493_length_475_cov_10.792553_1_plen_37_part_01
MAPPHPSSQMGVGAAPPAQGSTHTPISAGETAGRVPG